MRSRKTWGILGSFAGIAGSMAGLAYFSIALLATTSPVLASPPSCNSEEVDLAIARANEDVDTMIVMSRWVELYNCYSGGGSCLSEEVDYAIAEANWQTSVNIRQVKEFALAACLSE